MYYVRFKHIFDGMCCVPQLVLSYIGYLSMPMALHKNIATSGTFLFTADCDSETRMTIACYLQYQFGGMIFVSVQSQRSSFRYFCTNEMSNIVDITISLYGRNEKVRYILMKTSTVSFCIEETWEIVSGDWQQGKFQPLIAGFMGPTWGPSGADRTQVGPMLDPWTLLSGTMSKLLHESESSFARGPENLKDTHCYVQCLTHSVITHFTIPKMH